MIDNAIPAKVEEAVIQMRTEICCIVERLGLDYGQVLYSFMLVLPALVALSADADARKRALLTLRNSLMSEEVDAAVAEWGNLLQQSAKSVDRVKAEQWDA